MKKNNLDINSINHLENKIMQKANSKFILKYNGKNSLKNCIIEALNEELKLEEVQFSNLFGIYFDDYVNYLKEKMKEKGAVDNE